MRIVHLGIAVWLVALLFYGHCARFEFVTQDDSIYVYENDQVLSGLTASNVCWAATSCSYASNWHPLCWWSLQADASLASLVRKNPSRQTLSMVMHSHNVLLHAANAALLFFLLIVMGRSVGIDLDDANARLLCAAFSLIWAIHPLRSEVVCWVSERKEVASVFWMLLSMILWVSRRRDVGLSYFGSLICFALALLAKPVAVTLPVALFAWDWVIARKSFLKCIALTALFGVLTIGVCALTLLAQTEAMAGDEITRSQQIAMTLYAPVVYIRQTLIPYGLSAFYRIPEAVPVITTALGGLLVLALIAVCAFWILRREWWAAICTFGVAWAYVALVPMLGFVKVGSQPYSDRYTYWSGCAVVGVAWLLCAKLDKGKKLLVAKVLGGLLVVLAILTYQRNMVWSNSLALYSDAVPKSWDPRAVCCLASQFMLRGPEGAVQAEAMLRQAVMHSDAIDIRAEYARTLAYRARKSPITLNSSDRDPAFAEPRMDAQIVLQQSPTHPRAHEALAFILMKEGKHTEALKHLEVAQENEPKWEQGWLSNMIRDCRARASEEKNVQK